MSGKASVKSEYDGNKDKSFKNKSINCIQNFDYAISSKVCQNSVTINGLVTIDALPDNGSCVTLLKNVLLLKMLLYIIKVELMPHQMMIVHYVVGYRWEF